MSAALDMLDRVATMSAMSLGEGIVARLRAGDAEARRAFFERFWPISLRRARAVVHDSGDAHDVAAGVLADFAERHVHTMRSASEAAIGAYIITTTARRARALLARRRQMSQLAEETLTTEPADTEPVLLARLEECIARLSDRQRQLLQLRFGVGMTNADIAQTLDMSRSAITQAISKEPGGVLPRLKRCLTAPRWRAGGPNE